MKNFIKSTCVFLLFICFVAYNNKTGLHPIEGVYELAVAEEDRVISYTIFSDERELFIGASHLLEPRVIAQFSNIDFETAVFEVWDQFTSLRGELVDGDLQLANTVYDSEDSTTILFETTNIYNKVK
jgi:hypothetical protein